MTAVLFFRKTVLLSLKHGEFVWDCALPYRLNDPDCFPCIFVQFASPPSSPRDGNDTCVIQIFTKQARFRSTWYSLLPLTRPFL